ncbi:MAG: TlpA disulfide reductase family protein [Candidatus Delongbacteria bacterium]|jgi:thiol-disulfide isomerase/thioredoxin|nr:TlpA disulfide reductase family protein [Candidatus Delongbacteria bacterium]
MKKTKTINNTFFLAIALCIMLIACNLPKNKDFKNTQICLQGKILNPVNEPLLAELNHKTDSIDIDSLNEFIHCIETNKAAYIDIKLRRMQFTIYAHPGDTIHFTIDAGEHKNPVVFHGNDTNASEYLYALRTQKLTHPAFNELLRQDSVEKFMAGTENLHDTLFFHLNQYASYFDDAYFISQEKSRIDYLIKHQKMVYSKYYAYMTGKPIPDSAAYFSFITQTEIEDPQSLVLPEYLNYLENAFLLQLDNNPDTTSSYCDDIKYQLKSIRKKFDNQDIKLALYNTILTGYAQYNGFESLDSEYTWLTTNMTNNNKRSKLETLHATWDKISKGKKAPGFTYPDTSGDSISLSDFKGKPIYIDVWASWCGPCIREMPYMDSLHNEYKDKNIVFLSVSVDENKNNWLNFLEKHTPAWDQLHTGGWDCKLCNDYNIKAIPRFLLIDRNGKIISASAPRPSSDEIKPLLDEHIKMPL